MSSFYEAGTFWLSAAGAAATIVVGFSADWIASRTAPKRRLLYRASDSVALLAKRNGLPHGLEVHGGGRKLQDPRIIEVFLQSDGRQSITRESFDDGQPISITLGAQVVDILDATSRPTEQAIPNYGFSGSTLNIGPGALAAKQQLRFALLVDGEPKLTLISHLPDVKVRRQQISSEQTRRRRILTSVVVATAATAAILIGYTRFTASHVTTPVTVPVAQAIAYKMLASKYGGYSTPKQFDCLNNVWSNESGWRYNAEDPSGAYGIPQARPGDKMAAMGPNWRTDATTQIKWGLSYIAIRYKNPCNAWKFWQVHHFY